MTLDGAAAGGASGRREAIEAVWSFFVSLKLTLWLLVALAAASALGTFLAPSPVGVDALLAKLGPGPVYWLARAFELDDLFRSWWFTTLLWALALNLVACTLERLPRVWDLAFKTQRRLTDASLAERRHVSRHPRYGDLAADVARVKAAMVEHGFEPRVEEDGETVYLFAERGRTSRFGAHVTHVALLVILAGGIFGRLWGAQGEVKVSESNGGFEGVPIRASGADSFPRPLGFAVVVREFRFLDAAEGTTRQPESDLVIYQGQEPVLRQSISVNHPLQYEGWTFYQAGFEPIPNAMIARIEIEDRATGTRSRHKLLREQSVEMTDGVVFGVLDYQEDHVGAGPALHLARVEDGLYTDFWVFQRYPGFDLANREDRWGVDFPGVEPMYFTGIRAVRDPGADVVFAGCVLLAFGLAQSFYSSHRRLWARVDGQGIVLAGSTHRSPQAFARVFNLIDALIRSPA